MTVIEEYRRRGVDKKTLYYIMKVNFYYEGEVWLIYRMGKKDKFVHKIQNGDKSFDGVMEIVKKISNKEMKGNIEKAHDLEGKYKKRKF